MNAQPLWPDGGLCRQYSAEMFFPDDLRGRDRTAMEQRAKAVCGECPVLSTCRDHALNEPEPYGIWGGLNPRERQSILARGRARCTRRRDRDPLTALSR